MSFDPNSIRFRVLVGSADHGVAEHCRWPSTAAYYALSFANPGEIITVRIEAIPENGKPEHVEVGACYYVIASDKRVIPLHSNNPAAMQAGPPAASSVAVPPRALLDKDSVQWVVNDNAELGVKIGDQFFWLYKGDSIEYQTGKHDNGRPMYWRLVGKREFGECCRPPHLKSVPEAGSYTLGDNWQELPSAP